MPCGYGAGHYELICRLNAAERARPLEMVKSLEIPTLPWVDPVKAFPTAEGFGAGAVGGRGGRVIEVTNLDASGPGSLRNCLEASGPRICVFRVSGTITLTSAIQVRTPTLPWPGRHPRAGCRSKGLANRTATGAFGLSTAPTISSFATSACGWAAT